jgi:hypothetical protein
MASAFALATIESSLGSRRASDREALTLVASVDPV